MHVNSKQAEAMLTEYAALIELNKLAPKSTSQERQAKIGAWAEAQARRRTVG